MAQNLLLEAYQKQPWINSIAVIALCGMVTYTKEPSQVIKTVQLKPKMERKPNRRWWFTCQPYVLVQLRRTITFNTAFFPNLASARLSCVSVESFWITVSSTSRLLEEEGAIGGPEQENWLKKPNASEGVRMYKGTQQDEDWGQYKMNGATVPACITDG